jgi:Ca2+/Na+ antiporter
MELDELKQLWDQTPLTHRENKDLMELIQHKSYGPVAALKKVYKKQIIMMLVLPLVLLLTNLRDINIVLTSVMFWSYVAFCIAMIVFAWYNYRLVRKMEGMDGVVKTNLEQQIEQSWKCLS